MVNKINNFLNNNVVYGVSKFRSYNKELYKIHAKTGNTMDVSYHEFLNNEYVINKIMFDFEELYNYYIKNTRNVEIRKGDINIENNKPLYSITYEDNKILIVLNSNISDFISISLTNMIKEALVKLVERILKSNSSKTEYDILSIDNKQNTYNAEVLKHPLISTKVIYDDVSYVGDAMFLKMVERINNDIDLGEKIQLKFPENRKGDYNEE